jgi:integrase
MDDYTPESSDQGAPAPLRHFRAVYAAHVVALLKQHGYRRLDDMCGRPAKHPRSQHVSEITYNLRSGVLFELMHDLRGAGYLIESPRQLQSKHVTFLVRLWYSRGLGASTLANRMSVLHWLELAIGKPNMVQSIKLHLPDVPIPKRSLVTKTDKSWRARGVDAAERIEEICKEDPVTGMLLRMQRDFGLRTREAVRFKPLERIERDGIWGWEGTKGGRERFIRFSRDPVVAERQRETLRAARAMVRNLPRQHAYLGYQGRTLKASVRHYHRCLAKLGICRMTGLTPHGLRHERAQTEYEALAQAPAPLQGGGADRARHRWALGHVSQMLGHARLSIPAAYIGSEAHNAKLRRVVVRNLEAFAPLLPPVHAICRLHGLRGSLWLVGARGSGLAEHGAWEIALTDPLSTQTRVDLELELERAVGQRVNVASMSQPAGLKLTELSQEAPDTVVQARHLWSPLTDPVGKASSQPVINQL